MVFKNYLPITEELENCLVVAVSKYQTDETVQLMIDQGHQHFGENRVVDLLRRQNHWPLVHWHLLGHLQTNKVKDVIGKTWLIHSLDSIKLADIIEQQSKKQGMVSDCLIQVKLTDEPSKSGVGLDEWQALFEHCLHLSAVKIRGLMCIGPNTDDQQAISEVFAKAHEMFVHMQKQSADVQWLSMGMSGDYHLAVQQGSNMVRLGTVLFERGNENA